MTSIFIYSQGAWPKIVISSILLSTANRAQGGSWKDMWLLHKVKKLSCHLHQSRLNSCSNQHSAGRSIRHLSSCWQLLFGQLHCSAVQAKIVGSADCLIWSEYLMYERRENVWKRDVLHQLFVTFVTTVILERSSDASLWPTCVAGSVVNDITVFALGCIWLARSEKEAWQTLGIVKQILQLFRVLKTWNWISLNQIIKLCQQDTAEQILLSRN